MKAIDSSARQQPIVGAIAALLFAMGLPSAGLSLELTATPALAPGPQSLAAGLPPPPSAVALPGEPLVLGLPAAPRILPLSASRSPAYRDQSVTTAAPHSERESIAEEMVEQGTRYEHGEGVIKDPHRAAALYCSAAQLGSAEGQFKLGWMYANGRGIGRNNRFAASLFALAAQQGHEYGARMAAFVGPDRGEFPPCLSGQDPSDSVQLAAHSTREGNTLYATDPENADLAPIPTWSFASPERQQVVALVHKLAPAYRIEPGLALAVIQAESGFDPRAVSPKNAQGLMQLLPETAARFGVKNTFDPAQNVRGGLAYLRWLLAYFRGNVLLAAAAYNAGEGAVDRYRGIPPFAETRQYVKKIAKYFPRTFHVFDPTAAEISSSLAVLPRSSS